MEIKILVKLSYEVTSGNYTSSFPIIAQSHCGYSIARILQ